MLKLEPVHKENGNGNGDEENGNAMTYNQRV